MKPKTKKDLDRNLGNVVEAIDYIEDKQAKAFILNIVAVYHKRVLIQIEQSQFKKRNQEVEQIDEMIVRLEERLQQAYACGIGISDAEDALRSAWLVRDAAFNHSLEPINLDTAEMYVDTEEFDNHEL